MKIKFAGLILVASLAALPISMMTGCAVTSGRESAGEYVDDKTLGTKIKTALTRDPTVKAHQVNVTAFRGAVQLSGFVDSQEQKDRATEIIKNMEGVKELHNDLVVATGRASGDLKADANTDTEIKGETKIKAEDGTIKGEVDVDKK
ncbi:MAG TPA: BON domain-containing protein [Verrucomicrobiae bacterium]|nr:BON domain-containing protein [Verrucomicrobiae bacterium]